METFSKIRLLYRPTSRSSGGNQNSNGVSLPAGLADDQSKDFDFEKTEMKYDSTGMFHWSPARNLEDCILVSIYTIEITMTFQMCIYFQSQHMFSFCYRTGTRRP